MRRRWSAWGGAERTFARGVAYRLANPTIGARAIAHVAQRRQPRRAPLVADRPPDDLGRDRRAVLAPQRDRVGALVVGSHAGGAGGAIRGHDQVRPRATDDVRELPAEQRRVRRVDRDDAPPLVDRDRLARAEEAGEALRRLALRRLGMPTRTPGHDIGGHIPVTSLADTTIPQGGNANEKSCQAIRFHWCHGTRRQASFRRSSSSGKSGTCTSPGGPDRRAA